MSVRKTVSRDLVWAYYRMSLVHAPAAELQAIAELSYAIPFHE